ncbi:MAG: type II toxin-antitoxin system PemK/MazF family toxin [Planctomycetes bacterium]|nr:type II toxin-antitoxin system PemK/MazF family toxin [Planctomycetota bacterium]
MADLEPVRGSEQGRRRPVVVFQNPALSSYTSTLLAIPLTTNMARKGLIGTCYLHAGDGGLPENSIALAFQARALDRTRLTRRLGKLSDDSIDALAEAVLSAFGIAVAP